MYLKANPTIAKAFDTGWLFRLFMKLDMGILDAYIVWTTNNPEFKKDRNI